MLKQLLYSLFVYIQYFCMCLFLLAPEEEYLMLEKLRDLIILIPYRVNYTKARLLKGLRRFTVGNWVS